MQEPSISIRDMLYANWVIPTPAADSMKETFVPGLVHFTTREYATNPRRIHNYQVSVRTGPARMSHVPEEIGSLVMYRVEQPVNIHVWAVVGIGDDYETVEQNTQNMMDAVDNIVRVKSTAESGVGIQFIRDSPGWQNSDELTSHLVFHRVMPVTAIYYRTETSITPTPSGGLWGTAVWGNFNWS
jgi:hypothetical protein